MTNLTRYAEEHRVWSHHYKTAEARLAALAEQEAPEQEAPAPATEEILQDCTTHINRHPKDDACELAKQAEELNRTRLRLAALHARNAELADLKRRLSTAQLAQERALLQQHKLQAIRAHAEEERLLEEQLIRQDAAVRSFEHCAHRKHFCTCRQLRRRHGLVSRRLAWPSSTPGRPWTSSCTSANTPRQLPWCGVAIQLQPAPAINQPSGNGRG